VKAGTIQLKRILTMDEQPKLGLAMSTDQDGREHTPHGCGGTRLAFRNTSGGADTNARTVAARTKFSARARKTAREAGALPNRFPSRTFCKSGTLSRFIALIDRQRIAHVCSRQIECWHHQQFSKAIL